MEDQSHSHPTTTTKSASSSGQPASTKHARSRWVPMSEQILFMESIFKSGTVNPSKDDIIRIRCLLEEFGPISDTNVFYWFQNRRSRFRRQRQLQLQATANSLQPPTTSLGDGGAGLHLHYTSNSTQPENLGLYNINNNIISLGGGGVGCQLAPSSLCGGFAPPAGGGSDVFLIPLISLSDHNPTSGGEGIITVFVNGMATQVPAGSFDVKAVFGQDVVLVHSTGAPVPVDDFGFCFHGLLHGEAYFLV